MFLIFDNLRLFMMTTNLFVIANVKQLRTGGSFRILLPFLRTSWGVGFLNSAIFNSFHNRVEFGTILEGFGISGRGVVWTPQTPLGTPLLSALFKTLSLKQHVSTSVCHLQVFWNCNRLSVFVCYSCSPSCACLGPFVRPSLTLIQTVSVSNSSTNDNPSQ